MASFSLIMRSNMVVECKKETMIFITKEEIVQQIRTNFAMYTEYVPSTTMIMEKMDEHLILCSSVNHTFFEVEPVCSISWCSDPISLQRDLQRCFHFMKHLSSYGKKMFLNKYLFDLVNINVDTFKFWLDPPNFESNVDKLLSSINGSGFARDIILKKYKQHLNECKGPCKLNVFGVPICKKKKCEIEKIEKMFYALYLFLQTESSVQLRQILFDMIYEPNQYNNVVDFMAINASRNTKLQKIIGK